MQHEFKIGDEWVTRDKRVVKIDAIINRTLRCDDKTYRWIGNGKRYSDSRIHESDLMHRKTIPFPLYSEEQAVAFLTEKGYSVQAPPEPLKGQSVVYIYANETKPRVLPREEFENLNVGSGKHNRKVLAIVDWTEGQGLGKDGSKSV